MENENQQQEPVAPKAVHGKTVQTADNTTFHDYLPPKSQSIGQFDPEDGKPFFNAVMGLTSDNIENISKAIENWQNYILADNLKTSSPRELQRVGVTEEECQDYIRIWEEYCETSHPGKTVQDVTDQYRMVFQAFNAYVDTITVRFPVVKGDRLTNISARTSNAVMQKSDITGRIPTKGGVLGKDQSLADFMVKAARGSQNEPHEYDLLLRNSYLAIKLPRPSRTDGGMLIKDIAKRLTGHVRSVQRHVPVLANIAVIEVIWKFLLKRMGASTMKDQTSAEELGDIVRINDINVIGAYLLSLFYPDGVRLALTCLSKDGPCGHRSHDVIDPLLMVIDRKHLDTPEESAAYANMYNFSRKYSREESLEFIKNSNYGVEIPMVMNKNNTIGFVIGTPSINDSIEALGVYEDFIKAEMDDIRETSLDEKTYQTRVDEFLNGLVGTDYMHYISEYHIIPEDAGAPTVKIKRNEHDPVGYNQGLLKVITENEELGEELIKTVIEVYPYMSKTFIGLENVPCPNPECNGTAAASDMLSYTPFNIISTFFTLAGLKISGLPQVGVKAINEALSSITQNR